MFHKKWHCWIFFGSPSGENSPKVNTNINTTNYLLLTQNLLIQNISINPQKSIGKKFLCICVFWASVAPKRTPMFFKEQGLSCPRSHYVFEGKNKIKSLKTWLFLKDKRFKLFPWAILVFFLQGHDCSLGKKRLNLFPEQLKFILLSTWLFFRKKRCLNCSLGQFKLLIERKKQLPQKTMNFSWGKT